MSSPKSLYDVLGVKKTDSCTDIKKAYLKLARVHHPDKGGDPERFKEIQGANEILSDEGRRRLYDDHGITDPNGGGMGGGGMSGMPGMPPGMGGVPFPFEVNLNDLFGGMFGSPPVGIPRGPVRKQKKMPPTVQTYPITLEQFYLGHQFQVNVNRNTFCSACDHTGAKTKELCKACNGQGAVTQVVQMGLMAMHTTGPCRECNAKGEKIIESCTACNGSGYIAESRALTVKLLPGTKREEVFIFQGVCSDHPGFEQPGDMHLQMVEDTNDPAYSIYRRTGDLLQHLEVIVTLSLAESLLGCVIQLDQHPGYDNGLFIRLPAGSFQNDVYALDGFGMPIPGQIGRYGDLRIHIVVHIKPTERALFQTKGREALTAFFGDKIRSVAVGDEAIQGDVYLYKAN